MYFPYVTHSVCIVSQNIKLLHLFVCVTYTCPTLLLFGSSNYHPFLIIVAVGLLLFLILFFFFVVVISGSDGQSFLSDDTNSFFFLFLDDDSVAGVLLELELLLLFLLLRQGRPPSSLFYPTLCCSITNVSVDTDTMARSLFLLESHLTSISLMFFCSTMSDNDNNGFCFNKDNTI